MHRHRKHDKDCFILDNEVMDKLETLKGIRNTGTVKKLTNKFEYDEFDLGPDLDILLESADSDLEVIDDDRPISRMEFYTQRYSYSSDSGSPQWRSSADTEIEKSEESDQLPDLIPIDMSEYGPNPKNENSNEIEVYYEASVVVEAKPNLELTKDICELNQVFENLSVEQKQKDTEIFEKIYIRNRTKNSNQEDFYKIILTNPIHTQNHKVGGFEQS